MPDTSRPTAAELRAARSERRNTRDRDLAASLGVSEAELVAAHVGHGAVRIAPHPDRLFPPLAALGPVMGLTRNESCVIEKTGVYDNYQGGGHAALVVSGEIDLRRLYILPAYQGRGLGHALFGASLGAFPDARAIRLEVEPNNAPAIAFYTRAGLSRVAHGSACGGDHAAGVAHLVMRKSL